MRPPRHNAFAEPAPVTAATGFLAAQAMPGVFRIEALIRLPDGSGGIRNQAKLAALDAVLWVEWRSRVIDVRLRRGQRVVTLRDVSAPASPRVAVHALMPLMAEEFLRDED